jgi:hypothetical protein
MSNHELPFQQSIRRQVFIWVNRNIFDEFGHLGHHGLIQRTNGIRVRLHVPRQKR